MKKTFNLLIMLVLVVCLTGCGIFSSYEKKNDVTEKASKRKHENHIHDNQEEYDSEPTAVVPVKQSPDKYTWYVKNYVGKNCASFGYTSMGGDRRDTYGAANVELIFVTTDGSYFNFENEDILKEYFVTGQNISPNSEMKLTFEKDSNGEEYDYLVDSQSYDEIVLSVAKVGSKDKMSLTEINPSPDKYTRYIADYVGRNLANFGYTSIGGDRRVECGAANLKLIIMSEDGSFIDLDDLETLKQYVVTSQNVTPNTELKLVFAKDSNEIEYSNLVESQSIEEIDLYVKKIN